MSVPIQALQRFLEDLYDLDPAAPVTDFLCSAETARALGGDPTRGELVLVAGDAQDLQLAVYLDDEALQAPGALGAEGVSHFLYLVHCHNASRGTSQLELELQGEVDKFAVSFLEGNGVGLLRARSEAARRSQFDAPKFIDGENSPLGARYRRAVALAARYTESLERRHLRRGALAAFIVELRAFYRMTEREKLRATHS